MHLTYFTNRYPAVSHTFVRREIAALEAAGVSVRRVALRADPLERLPDPVDRAELARTTLMLAGPKARLAGRIAAAAARRPARALGVLGFAWRHAARAGLGRAKVLAYWAEALLLVEAARGTDLVRVHFGTNGALVARLARRLGGPPYSVAYHGPDEFDAPERWDLRGTIAESAFVSAISHFCAGQLMRWSDPADWARIGTVPCIVDGEAFRPEPLPEGPLRLATVARLAPQKGLPLLLDALARVPDPPHLTIVGDGPFRPALEAQARRLGLADRVRFTGALSGADVRATLVAAHAFVLPSFAEGLPVVIMEAMAVGRPVLATEIAAIGELVTPETGRLVPSGSARALADAIAALAGTPRATLAAMGEAGAARVRRRHLAEHAVRPLVALCEAGLKSRSAF